jgi:dUTP pyrophosphatase
MRIKNESKHPLPQYATSDSAGCDLRANIDEPVSIGPLQRVLIPTGLFIEIPHGFEGQIRPRSGLAFKYGITVLNAPGTIDADYRGEIKVLLINLSEQVSDLDDSERGAGGFGHTGLK